MGTWRWYYNLTSEKEGDGARLRRGSARRRSFRMSTAPCPLEMPILPERLWLPLWEQVYIETKCALTVRSTPEEFRVGRILPLPIPPYAGGSVEPVPKVMATPIRLHPGSTLCILSGWAGVCSIATAGSS